MSSTIVSPGQAPILLKDVSQVLGITVSYPTLLRWVLKGVGGQRLPGFKIGGRWFLDPADWQPFIDRLNACPKRTPLTMRGKKDSVSTKSGKVSQREIPQQVEDQLDAIFGPRKREHKPIRKGG